jgi:uncharacterized protein YukE
MATGAYQINPTAVATVTSNVAGLTSQTGSVVSGLQSAVLDAVSFAQIGSAVGGANSSMHSQLVNALGKLVQLLTQINQNVQTSAQNYAQADTAVAQAYGGNTQLAQNATPAAPATPTPTPTPAPTPAPAHLAPAVVDQIMRSEGATGEQGGVPEAYGFRQNMHNGYDQIMAARAQYGQGSPQEHQVVADLLENNARAAGALNFTDPGVQAAIMSAAHMRGVGGAQAILNSVGGDPIQQSGTLSQNSINTIQNMTPDQFQQQFHDTRIQYDQTVYGNTVTHQGGQTDTWWHRYGNGLTNRYNTEQQQYLDLSNGANNPQ